MARLVYHTQSPLSAANVAAKRWIPTAGIWGVGVGVAALYLLSVTPLVKREFLSNVPMLGEYYKDKTPASDKPF
ncbi:hypothetical protein AX15_002957 [Amanita polypyramis BW_CC]|nr:hypothetical protein AX15_002957 [Amanita polypyramis BW_CC]